MPPMRSAGEPGPVNRWVEAKIEALNSTVEAMLALRGWTLIYVTVATFLLTLLWIWLALLVSESLWWTALLAYPYVFGRQARWHHDHDRLHEEIEKFRGEI